MHVTDHASRLEFVPTFDPNPRVALVAYLRFRVREDVKKTKTRPFAREVGVSHPVILDIVSGVHRLTKSETVEKLAAHFGRTMPQLYADAEAFALERPDLVAEETGGATGTSGESHVVYDHARSPKFGALPDWDATLAQAKKKYRHVRDDAWAGAARASTAEFPNGGKLDPDLLLSLAQNWEWMQAARPQTEAEAQAEIDADEPLDPVDPPGKPKK